MLDLVVTLHRERCCQQASHQAVSRPCWPSREAHLRIQPQQAEQKERVVAEVQLLEPGQIPKQAVAIRVVEEVPLHELDTVLDEVKPLNQHEPHEEASKPDSTASRWQGYSNTHAPNLRGPFFGAAE